MRSKRKTTYIYYTHAYRQSDKYFSSCLCIQTVYVRPQCQKWKKEGVEKKGIKTSRWENCGLSDTKEAAKSIPKNRASEPIYAYACLYEYVLVYLWWWRSWTKMRVLRSNQSFLKRKKQKAQLHAYGNQFRVGATLKCDILLLLLLLHWSAIYTSWLVNNIMA